MTTPQVFLPVDPTGVAPDNFISGEYHQITSGSKTVIRPNFGDFFTQGLQLYGVAAESNMTLMRPGVDYAFGNLNEQATAVSAGDVYQVILIKDTRFFTTFSLSYHAYGGANNINYTRLYNLYLQSTYGTPTPWSGLASVPPTFNPAKHSHDALDLYGFEYITAFLKSLKDTMTVARTSGAKYADLRLKLRTFESELQATSSALPAAARQHVDNTGFAHAYTKAMIGLGKVANYAFVPLTVNGVTLPAYASPQVLDYWSHNPPVYNAPVHVGLTNNPHGTTPVDIGLSEVQNLGFTASYAQNNATYQTLISHDAQEVYLGPAPFVWGVTEYANHVYSVVTQPIIDSVIDDAQGKINQATDILSSTAGVQTSIQAMLTPLQSSVVDIDRKAQQAVALNNRFMIVNGNSKFSETLIQLLLTDRQSRLKNASVYSDGFMPVPSFLDGLELWLSARNPLNELLVDLNGQTRVTKLVDLSSSARVFAAPANTAPLLAAPQDIADQKQGMSQGQVLRFQPGQCLDQLSGPAFQLRPGMTVIALVRTGEAGSQLALLTDPRAAQDTGLYGYTTTGQSLAIRSGTAWKPLETPTNSTPANTSGIVAGVVSANSEQFCWVASSTAINYIPHPRGVSTPASPWPSNNFRSTALTQMGNANYGVNNQGEIAELIVFRRGLYKPEVRALEQYLKMVYSEMTALSVDFSAINAF